MKQHDAMILAFIASVQNALQNQNDLIRNLTIEITSLRHSQADFCKQGDELRKLEVEHIKLKSTVEMQAIRIAHLEANLEGCNRDAIKVVTNEVMESRKACIQDVDKLKEHLHTLEKTYVETLGDLKQDMSQVKNVCTPKTWATRVMENPPVSNATTMRLVMQEKNPNEVDMEEWRERERRSKNIVIRGLPEKEKETTQANAADLEEFFHMHFGMSGINVYGAHRVGKPGAPRSTARAIVCTMVDDTKRNIIIEHSRFYLKGTTFSVCEDRTPKQQEACRKAYEERMAKNKPPTEVIENTHDT